MSIDDGEPDANTEVKTFITTLETGFFRSTSAIYLFRLLQGELYYFEGEHHVWIKIPEDQYKFIEGGLLGGDPVGLSVDYGIDWLNYDVYNVINHYYEYHEVYKDKKWD